MTLRALWARIQTWGAPTAAPDATIAPLAPPALAQEQFANAARATAAARQERTEKLYGRVVRANNAYVTRNYGFGDEVVSEKPSVAPISAAERAEMNELRLDVRFRKEPDLAGK